MTSFETSLDQIRQLNERRQQQIDALTRPAKEISRLAESLSLKMPAVKLSSEFTASMKASQAIMDRFADIKIPPIKLSTEFTASMKASQAIMDRFADIRVPALKQYDELSTIQMRIHKHLASITLSNNRPALLHHRGLDLMPANPVDPPVVSQVSPAEDILRRVSKQYQSKKRCEEDPRHVVVIAVTLLTGKRLCDPSMSAHGNHLIRIRGEDSSKQRYDVVVGYASFQYEILTIEIPPQSPTLRIV